MINQNTSALGIIFPNNYDGLVPELVNVRMMASIPFASRYRMIDFLLSSMANSDISNISIVPNRHYHSLMDHLGSGREWDLVRKNGGLNIFPPFADASVEATPGRIGKLANILNFFRAQKEKYVVLADTNIAVNFDFKAMIKAHIESGADVTCAYSVEELPESVQNSTRNDQGFYYTFDVDGDGRITDIYVNNHSSGLKNFSMNFYVIDRELFVKLFDEAFVNGDNYFERDVLRNRLDTLKIYGYKYEGYLSRIFGMKSYFDANMALLDDENLDGLFSHAPIYTKIRDDNPTRYLDGAKASNVMVADGCVIEGTVENSVLFRGVKVKKGAKVRNCVIMQGCVIEEDASLEYMVLDKSVTVTAGKEMKGTDTLPLYIAKKCTV